MELLTGSLIVEWVLVISTRDCRSQSRHTKDSKIGNLSTQFDAQIESKIDGTRELSSRATNPVAQIGDS